MLVPFINLCYNLQCIFIIAFIACGGKIMIEYIKMLIVAVVTGLTAPLPASSAAHFNFFAGVTGLSAEDERLTLYYSVFMLMFSLVILFSFRKTVTRGFRLAFRPDSLKGAGKVKDKNYFVKNILFSLLPTPLLFIPVSKGKLLVDYMDSFLNVNGLILSGLACITTSAVLLVSIWYTSKSKNPIRRAVDKKIVLRMSFYQLPCYIIPGFSHIASGAVNFFISDIGSKSLPGQLYIYLAPSMFFVSLIKIIRLLASGILFDPIILLAGAVVFALASKLIINLVLKLNIRRLFSFFSIYSAVFGIFITLISFFIK